MLGRSSHEVAGTRVPDIAHPDDPASDATAMQRMAVGDAATYRAEKRYLHADGQHVWASQSASVVRDAHGRPL